MKVLALCCCLSFLACGSRSVGPSEPKGDTAVSEPSNRQPVVAAVFMMSLEFAEPVGNPPTTQISLVETNETGANKRHNLGVFDGSCKDVTPDVRLTDPQVFLAFHCEPAETQRGVLVHIIARRSKLILLRAWLGATKPEFDEFDQIGELPPFPTGIPLKTEYDP